MNRITIALVVLLMPFACRSALSQTPLRLLDTDWKTDFSKTTIDLSELSVNLARDGIPALSNPKTVSVRKASGWISDQEPVISVLVNGQARAYPLQILIWHEIVNDDLAGESILVTFCPLCYSALAFERTIEGANYEFGVSGMLRHSDMIMYDRQTHSLFQQLNGTGLVGRLASKKLTPIHAQIISFMQFADAYPNGTVLSRNTGHSRSYGQNPYPGYDDIKDRPWLFKGKIDPRLPPMEKVIGVDLNGIQIAYPFSVTRKLNVIHDSVGGVNLVVFHSKNGAVSAMDDQHISQSRNQGSTGVFRSELDGQTLRFEPSGSGFIDFGTKSLWDIRDGPGSSDRIS